jgi:hypothetical protein
MVANTNVTVILVVVGAILLLVGVAGGYLSSLSSPEYFMIWMAVAFVGIILALAGFAMGMGGGKSDKE